jgi:hypothetical protein
MSSTDDDSLEFPTKESHEIAYQIGRVCIAWSNWEVLVSALLASYLRLKDKTRNELINGAIELRKKMELCRHFAFLIEAPDRFAQVSTLFSLVDNHFRSERNRFVHDYYVFSPQKTERTSHRARLHKIQSRTFRLDSIQTSELQASDIVEFLRDFSTCQQYLAGLVVLGFARDLDTKHEEHGQKREAFLRAAEKVLQNEFGVLKPILVKYTRAPTAAGPNAPV